MCSSDLAGPICTNGGTKIKIGVFTDADCLYLDETKEVDDYLYVNGVSFSLSNLILKDTYTDTCISCKEQAEQNENAKEDYVEDTDEVIALCEQLYDESAKCEKAHGFADSYSGNGNELTEEEIVCEDDMGSFPFRVAERLPSRECIKVHPTTMRKKQALRRTHIERLVVHMMKMVQSVFRVPVHTVCRANNTSRVDRNSL